MQNPKLEERAAATTEDIVEDHPMVAAPAPYAVQPTYAIDLHEAKLSWNLGQAENRTIAASIALDKASTWKLIHVAAVGATVVLWMLRNLLPPASGFQLGSFLTVAQIALLISRIGFVHRLSGVALACADSERGIPTRLLQVVLAFLVPFYNFVMPFRIMRRLADASTTDDLPRVRVVHELPETATYRSAPKRVVTDASPPAPTVPMLALWQGLFITTAFFSYALVGTLLVVGCVAYEAFVFHRMHQRFAARIRHLKEIARAIVPAR